MVLFKRKPVKFLPPPTNIEDEDAEVWHIPQTGEIFVAYDEYLARMDFYKQARFNNQITGHSGMTFFDALKGELAGGQEVEAAFPEALKGPVLRKAQFQIVSRLDHLVDMIFDDFKADYFPGEAVLVSLDGTERKVQGVIRDKTSIGARTLPDGTKTKPLKRYLVDLHNIPEEHSAREEHVTRERGIFTKAMIRSFIKKTVTREAWNGAPWLVRPEYATQYYIDTRVPPHLRYETKLQERKQAQAQKRALHPNDTNGSPGGPVRLPDLKPAAKSHKAKGAQGKGAKEDGTPNGAHSNDLSRLAQEPTPPPPPKYPIEDLEVQPRDGVVRPTLEFLCRDPPTATDAANGHARESTLAEKIDMASLGPLLETWDTLNVYCEIFKLDSFTFDDFVEAMDVNSLDNSVQLFEEIHCSVLKILVDSPEDGGRLRITLPQLDEEDSDEEDDDEEEEKEATPEPEPKPSGRATRSSLAKAEAERIAAEAAKAEAAAEEEKLEAEMQTKHRAEELLEDYDWVDHLRQRDFEKGGWEKILVGLFYQLSKKARYEDKCEELLLKLVPPNEEPSQETVGVNYSQLDINDRAKALQILCMLTMETKKVRGYMEECSETMTKYRKEKIDWQRKKKAAIEETRQLHEQKRAIQPSATAPNSPKLDAADADESKLSFSMDDSQMDVDQDTEDTAADTPKIVKRRKGKVSEKQRKEDEEKQRKEQEKEKAKEEQTQSGLNTTQTKQLNKILKDLQKQEDIIKECEEEVAIIENDLREADCPRTRVLGKDRFWNRYYWFERNGMPYAGLPDSSTAFAGYANGCIWVQGPDDIEREGYIDVSEEQQNEYKTKFGLTPSERKAKEEGSTSVYNACQWGYISEPKKVEDLISWLDPRGYNELRLRKELVLYKDRIVKHMENRQKYLTETPEDEEKKEEKDDNANKRTSSRIKDKTPEIPDYRCLKWENSVALEELGHLHSQEPAKPRSRKQTKRKEAAAETPAPPAKKARKK